MEPEHLLIYAKECDVFYLQLNNVHDVMDLSCFYTIHFTIIPSMPKFFKSNHPDSNSLRIYFFHAQLMSH